MPTTAEHTIRDQRGVAMVITLMILLILAALAMAFAMLGASEPQIVANLQQSAEAMGLAEAGIEGVIWALNNPTVAPGGLAFPLPTTIPDPYNGNTDISLGTGVFRVTVTAGNPGRTEAVVTAEARVPSWASYRARKIVKATVTGLPYLDPPCAVCVADPHLDGNTIFDSRTSTCGSKKASYSKDHTQITGLTNTTTYGLFSNDAAPTTPNQLNSDYSQFVAASSFDSFKLTQSQIDFLKDLAQANETYYQGAKTFTGSIPNGVIFVDTVSGLPINPLNPADFGSLTITGDFGTAKGWIVVMGNLNVSSTGLYSGLLYIANRLIGYRAEGSAVENRLSGAIIAQNVVSSSDNSDFTTALGKNTTIEYNCDNIRTGGFTYPPFFVKPGSWREQSG